MTGRRAAFSAVFRRELATVLRTPGYGLLAVGLLAALGGFVVVGGGGATGFVPAIVDLLLPTEALVPLVAVGIGYRALLTDASSGELAVIRTYGVGAVTYVLAVLLARLLALAALVGVPYLLVGGYIWAAAAPDTGIYATHTGVDSPLLFVRFIAFVMCLGAAYLAAAAAVSTLASSRRSALALGGILLVGGVFGGDLAVLRSLGDSVAVGELAGLVAATPNGAFRGLVFEYVVALAFDAGGGYVAPDRALATLLGWTAIGTAVAVAALGVGRHAGTHVERARMRYLE